MEMTLDEAIKHLNESLADQSHDWGCEECKAEHEQLAEWLKELKDLREENKVLMRECDRLIKEKGALLKQHEQIAEYKRLLKAAVEDIVWLNEHTVDGEGQCLIETATDMETCLACPLNINNSHVCGWKHQAEALVALIGEDGDTND